MFGPDQPPGAISKGTVAPDPPSEINSDSGIRGKYAGSSWPHKLRQRGLCEWIHEQALTC